MTAMTATVPHYLVVDVQNDRPILVFVGTDPALDGGPVGEPVVVEFLPSHERFGRAGRPAQGRPVLGQARYSRTCFREFASPEDLWEAGFLPVGLYRICDDWSDYYSPWAVKSAAADDHTVKAGADQSA